jgi:hypothetical protein
MRHSPWSVSLLLALAGAVAPVASAAAGPAARLPVPDAAAQARSEKLIHDLFKNEYAKRTPADRAALAKTLLGQAGATSDDPAARYQLFIESADLAAQAGDGETAVRALAGLAALYDVNPIPLKTRALITAENVATAENAGKLADVALATADEAAAADDFAAVGQLASLAEAAAKRTKRVALVAGIQPHVADLRALALEYERTKAALDLLKSTPDDREAHLTVGTFYALHKGQWDVGLPHLARSSDPELSALAQRELSRPADGSQQVEIGDAWWSLADKYPGPSRPILQHHAQDWYRQARTSIAGLTLTRIDARLQNPATQPGIALTPGPGKVLADPIRAHAPGGAAIDLSALLDPAKDAVAGAWHPVVPSGVSVGEERYASLQFPYSPPEEYDLAVSFTRTAGDGSLALLLASHKKSFGFALDVKGEARFERVANKIAKDNPTTVPVVIANGRKYLLTVQVRNDRIRALLDGQLLTEWKTDFKDLARYALWKVSDDGLCGIGANGAAITFHSIELTEVTGKGKPTR